MGDISKGMAKTLQPAKKIYKKVQYTDQCGGVGPGPPVYFPEGVHQVHIGGEGGLLLLARVHDEKRLPTYRYIALVKKDEGRKRMNSPPTDR
jgi:hypothetical protein